MLQEYDLWSGRLPVDRMKASRFRLLRHLYRYLMVHQRPESFSRDGWMRRLMFDIVCYTAWPACDATDQHSAQVPGKLSVVQKKDFLL
jgi:hypothetical protein